MVKGEVPLHLGAVGEGKDAEIGPVVTQESRHAAVPAEGEQ